MLATGVLLSHVVHAGTERFGIGTGQLHLLSAPDTPLLHPAPVTRTPTAAAPVYISDQTSNRRLEAQRHLEQGKLLALCSAQHQLPAARKEC